MDVYRAIADSTRRTILDELQERDGQSLFELCARLSMRHGLTSTRQAVSQHLDALESAGLVVVRREGRYRLHHLRTEPLREIAARWPVDRSTAATPLPTTGEPMIRITLASVFVDDQAVALDFYTRVLGFELKHDVPLGDARWLTVVSPADPDGTELLLEPSTHPAVGPYRSALVADGIPATSFGVTDVHAEHKRLTGLGVRFTQPPTAMGPVTTAVFDDTCGNLIQIMS